MAYTVRPPKEKLRILFRTKLRIVFAGIKAENINALCCQEGIEAIDFGMEDWGLRDSRLKPRPHNDNGSVAGLLPSQGTRRPGSSERY